VIHYVYRIEKKLPTDDRKYYYGKHSGSIDDIGNTYFTSSKRIKSDFRENPNDFIVKIVRCFESSQDAILFESQIHKRLDVAKHPLFFNEQNQVAGKQTHDRTGMVTVKDRCDNVLNISVDLYNANKDLYTSLKAGLVSCKSLVTGKLIQVSKAEFDSDDNLVGVNYNKVDVIIIETGEKINVSKDEFDKNKHLYTTARNGKVACRNLSTGEVKQVSKAEFDSDDNLVGIMHGKRYKRKIK